jgi:hypothetical protein
MGLFDDIFAGGQGAAADAMRSGYENANQYLQPYQQGGVQDYNSLRNYTGNMNTNLSQYGNPMDSRWRNANMSAPDYYQQLMKGYAETPQAKYEQEVAMRAANQGASASGMLGSGAYYKALQNNAADIAQRDMQRYFENILQTDTQQMGYSQNYQQQQRDLQRIMEYLTSLGYGASQGIGQNEIGIGQANAEGELADASALNNFLGLAGQAGMAFL